MTIKYLYIDDQPEDTEGIALGLSVKPKKLKVEKPVIPKSWNEQIQFLIDNLKNFGGILLDLKLTVRSGSGDTIKYQSPALAQEMRNLAKEKKIADLPIILCSTDENFKKFYDNTSQDLFDATFEKEDMNGDLVIEEFIAYVETYEAIRKNKADLKKLLDSGDVDISQVQQYFDDLKTVHERAGLLKQVVEPSGILIDEELLAIRLGVNKSKSKDWESLLDELNESSKSKYKGVYSNVWQRWWMPLVAKWWNKTFPELFFQNTSASEKVTAIIKQFRFKKLISLELPKYHEYDSFWYKCSKSGIHMVSTDGLRTKGNPKYDWQDISYISNNFIRQSAPKQRKELRRTIYHFHKKSLEEILKQKNK